MKPDLVVTLKDARVGLDFGALTADRVNFIIEQDGRLVGTGPAYSIEPIMDGTRAIVKRAWQAGETDVAGRMWITVVVDWSPGADPQSFPADGPMRLDVLRQPGDA